MSPYERSNSQGAGEPFSLKQDVKSLSAEPEVPISSGHTRRQTMVPQEGLGALGFKVNSMTLEPTACWDL